MQRKAKSPNAKTTMEVRVATNDRVQAIRALHHLESADAVLTKMLDGELIIKPPTKA